MGPLFGAVLGFITLPLIAWLFPQEDIGRFTLYQAVLGFGVMLFSLAMHQAYVREYHESPDKGVLLKLTVLPGGIFFLIFSCIFIFSPLSLSVLIFDVSSLSLDFMILGGLLLSYLINILVHVLRMQERGVAFSVAEVMPRLSHLLFIAIIIIFFNAYDFQDLIASNIIALFVTFIALTFMLSPDIGSALRSRFNRRKMKSMLAFSMPLVVGSLSYWALTTMDRFFLRSLAGFEELGLYAVTVSIASVAAILSKIFSNLWHPTVYRWAKEGVRPDRVQTVVDYMLVGVLSIWALAGLLSWFITYLLPQEYNEIQYLVVACIAMPLLYMLSETTVVGIGITRRSVFSMLASILALVVNLILNFILIPEHGAAGAAMASAYSFCVFFVVRTESSCYVWENIRRNKMYLLLALYLMATTVTTFQFFESQMISSLIWLLLLFLTGIMFYSRLSHAFLFVRNKVIDRC